MHRLSRREFVRLSTAGAVASPLLVEPGLLRAAAPTAQEIVDRIRQTVGVPWKADTVDTFKAGHPSTVVTGVVTTSLATLDVLRRAVPAGAHLVITSGPTFYSRTDSPTPPAGRGRGAAAAPPADPVFTAKNELIRTNNMVVWRFSDHWRLRTPDPFAQGIVDALGWAKQPAGNVPGHVTIPAVTLETLVADVQAHLGIRGGMRIIGNPRTRLQTIAVLPGTVPIQAALSHLPKADAIIAGEIREWESSEYVRDAITAGRDKALVLVGRSVSEDPGMKVCAQWLGTIVPEAPVRWLPAGDPYWRPAA